MIEPLRLAFRSLRRRPGLTVAATLTIALGIGATTTIYSVVQASLLQPLPYTRPAELAQLVPVQNGEPGLQLSFPDFRDLRDASHAFAMMAPFRYYLFNLSGSGTPESVLGVYAGVDLFPLLGIDPALGRQFLPGGDESGRPPEALLTDQLWRRRYGADPAVVGHTVSIDGRPVTVAGILPAGFRLGELTPTDAPLPSREPDLYLSIGAEADDHNARGNGNYWVLGRLAPGTTLAQANSEVGLIAARLARQYPDDDAKLEVRALGLKAQIVGDSRRPLLVLLGAVGMLLLIACANVAGLLGHSRGRPPAGDRTPLGPGRLAVETGRPGGLRELRPRAAGRRGWCAAGLVEHSGISRRGSEYVAAALRGVARRPSARCRSRTDAADGAAERPAVGAQPGPALARRSTQGWKPWIGRPDAPQTAPDPDGGAGGALPGTALRCGAAVPEPAPGHRG